MGVGFDEAFLPACAAIIGSISMADISLMKGRLLRGLVVHDQ